MGKTNVDVRIFGGLLECAIAFSTLYPDSAFVPCFRSKDNRKPPCKGASEWETRRLTAGELKQFPQMEMLALVLEDKYFVFDCDSPQAWDALVSLSQLYPLPETLEISSGREGRKSLFYKLTKPLKVLADSPLNTLEYRTGKHYQVIAGLHPCGSIYQQNGKAIAELPEDWFEYLSKSDFLPENSDLVILQTFLNDAIDYDFGSPEYYDSWLNIGMIIHDIDASDEGLQTWIEWSKQSTRHEPEESEESCKMKWRSFGDCENPVTLGSLIHKLRESRNYKKNASECEAIITPLEKVAEKKGTKSPFSRLLPNFGNIERDSEIAAKKDLGFSSAQYARILAHEYEILSQEYTEETIEDYQQSIRRMLTVENLDVDSLIGDTSFGQILMAYADGTGRPLDYLFMSFLTAYASCLPKGLYYRVDQDQKTKPILFSVFVGDVASGKGLITTPFINPLMRESKRLNNEYMLLMDRHQKEVETLKKMPKAERFEQYLSAVGEFEGDDVDLKTQLEVLCPPPEQPHFPFLAMVTPERLRSLSGELKRYGFLVAPAEIHSLFSYMSKYSKDKGSDDLLYAWDGDTTQVNLQGEKYRTVDAYQVSILSGIQGKRFSEIFDVFDPSGMLSRFIWLPIQKSIELKRSEEPLEGLDIAPHFWNLYSGTQSTIRASDLDNPLIVEPSREAKRLWITWEKFQFSQAENYKHNHPGYASWLKRNPQYTTRIALILHCLFVQELNYEVEEMHRETMEKAIKVAAWLTKKAQLVYEAHEDHIDPIKARIHSDMISIASEKYGGKVLFKQLTSHAFLKRQEVKSVYCGDANRKKESTKALNKKEVALLFQDMSALGLGDFDQIECSFTVTIKK